MKHLFTFVLLCFSGILVQAQSFRESDSYTIKKVLTDKPFEYGPYVFQLYEVEDRTIALASFAVTEPELLESVRISTLEDVQLEGVAEAIRVEVEYLSCCSQVQVHYFLRTDDHKLITLPRLTNVYCEDTSQDLRYTFPGEPYGEEGLIIKGIHTYNEIQEIIDVVPQLSIAWNDDRFEHTGIAYGFNDEE